MNILDELEKTFMYIEYYMDSNSMEEFISCEYKDIYQFNFIFGLWIRNNLLVDEGKLLNIFKLAGITQIEDMTDLIIRLYYIYIKYKKKF